MDFVLDLFWGGWSSIIIDQQKKVPFGVKKQKRNKQK